MRCGNISLTWGPLTVDVASLLWFSIVPDIALNKEEILTVVHVHDRNRGHDPKKVGLCGLGMQSRTLFHSARENLTAVRKPHFCSILTASKIL